ncbi:MAG: hypothetical protein K2M31_01940 [Muribaculaceae bacterium]|nr:hypothetical protein [Muribaculaceae bacterium]
MKFTRLYTVLLVAVCVLGVALTGCKKEPTEAEKAQIQLAKMVDEMELPRKVPGATLTKVTYDDNVMTYSYEVAADTLAALKQEKLKERTLNNLRGSMGSLVSKIIKADADVVYIYYNGSDSLKLKFTADNIKGEDTADDTKGEE